MSSHAGPSNNEDDTTGQLDMLMRHSSPVVRENRGAQPSRSSRPPETDSRASPLRLSRPRSNPRTRTPMRYESPLNSDAFRRDTILESERESSTLTQQSTEGQRITIHRLAGSAVGALPSIQVRENHRGHQQRPSKQGPSRRKIRRWNNENFVTLAAEISGSSTRGRNAADVLLKAQAGASQYRSIYDPNEHRSKAISRFMEDEELKGLRDKFFKGELQHQPYVSLKSLQPSSPLTLRVMVERIDPRLRKVLVKAYHNSAPASSVISRFEKFLLCSFCSEVASGLTPDEDGWDGILLEEPTVSCQSSQDVVVGFRFSPNGATSGFHRLLLHGLCQFYGLKAVSSTETSCGRSARVLTASGKVDACEMGGSGMFERAMIGGENAIVRPLA